MDINDLETCTICHAAIASSQANAHYQWHDQLEDAPAHAEEERRRQAERNRLEGRR